jgi:hypothetical protein
MNKTHQQALDQRQMYVKEIGRIEGLPQTQRWRAIKNFLLKVKPELRHIDNQFINAIKEERESTLLETGATKSGSTRKLYSMPQYLYASLHLLDPEFTKLQDDPESSKAINLKIAKTFPEYAIARKI